MNFQNMNDNADGGADETGILFTRCAPVAGKAPEGYQLSVEILAQSIQADGKGKDGSGNDTSPVVLAWGAATGGSVESVDANGVLTVTPATTGQGG